MAHHAYLVAGPLDAAREAALSYVERELGLPPRGNPDIIEMRRGLFAIEDVRALMPLAYQAPVAGGAKALLIVAGRLYHEAQNALLKLFEEPSADTTLFLVVPSEGMIIGTLRSRLVALPGWKGGGGEVSEDARTFLAADAKARTAQITRLSGASGEDEKRAARDAALSILDGAERSIHARWRKGGEGQAEYAELLAEMETLRGYLLDRSSSIKMILEHIAIALPERIVS